MWREIEESLAGLRELFFPRECCVCGKPLQRGEEDICPDCFSDIPLTYFWDLEDNPVQRRLGEKCRITHGVSLFHFSGESGYHYLMHRVKFEGGRSLGFRLGHLLGRYMKDSGRFRDIDAVVPVPLHPLRQFRRGYNQAEVIASGIASSLGVPLVTNAVRRVKRTGTQTRLHGSEKRKNVEGAFAANEFQTKKMTGNGTGHILLVDDVLTSGATLSECAKQLLPYFKVSVASLSFVE